MPRRPVSPLLVLAALVLAACGDDSTTAPTDPGAAVAAAAAVWTQVTVGDQHTCALASTARAYCWGFAQDGALGIGTAPLNAVATPTRVAGGLSFAQISAGTEHTCAVTTDQKAYCWGANFFGRLGTGGTASTTTPAPVAGGHRFSQIRAGGFHTCALTSAGKAYCWGGNGYGALGDGTTTDRPAPVAVLGGLTFRRLMVGGQHTCGVTTADKAYCWGRGVEGQLGTGLQKNHPKPVAVSGGRTWRAVLPGSNHTCGITTADKAYCWGSYRTDTYTGLGTGDNTDGTLAPVPVAGTRTWRQLTAGSLHNLRRHAGRQPVLLGIQLQRPERRRHRYDRDGPADASRRRPQAHRHRHRPGAAPRERRPRGDAHLRHHRRRQDLLLGHEPLRPARHRPGVSGPATEQRPGVGPDAGVRRWRGGGVARWGRWVGPQMTQSTQMKRLSPPHLCVFCVHLRPVLMEPSSYQAAATGAAAWLRPSRAFTRFAAASAIRSASRPTPWIIVEDME
ncbi:MAG TPA: hypothetical protein VFJ92_11525 [Gemmatimonadales bacterium]|nr:hypothetical protein [Gemmatimonadales bacterium]